MKLSLPAKLARRYLFARKSFSAVNVISIVSVCGVAIATMAMICVLSVFNGFRDVIQSRMSRITPDILITPTQGKTLLTPDSIIAQISAIEGVELASPVVADNALLYSDHRQLPVRLLGVDAADYAQITDIKNILIPGSRYRLLSSEADLAQDESALSGVQNGDAQADMSEIEAVADAQFDEAALFTQDADFSVGEDADSEALPENFALLSPGLLIQLGHGAGISGGEIPDHVVPEVFGISLFVPRRTASVNTANPAASFLVDSVGVEGSFRAEQQEFDTNTVIVDINFARRLFEYDTQASQIYVKTRPGADTSAVADRIQELLGNRCKVVDRMQQESLHYRMMEIEKWITFLLLSFILLIASFNIVSTLCMLIIEKREGINILRRLGATKSLIGRVFCLESVYVSAFGAVAGIFLGLLLCELQIHYHLIGIPNDNSGNLIINTYPVVVKVTDILLVLLPIAAITAVTSFVASRFARRQIE